MLPHEGGMIDNVGSLSIVVDDLHRFRGAGGITGLRKSASSEKRRKEVPGGAIVDSWGCGRRETV